MTLFKNKYRIESIRLPGWDYGQPGHYFVTLCTKKRAHFFGKVVSGEMQLSPMGQIVAEEWMRTEQIRPNVRLDEWIIMPDHMHMILVITHKIESQQPVEMPRRGPVEMPQRGPVETPRRGPVETPRRGPVETPRRGVSTGQRDPSTKAASEKWAANTVGSIIGQFKGVCTKRIRALGYENFAWQPRYYEHIVRSRDALHRIRRYIALNPVKWDEKG